MSEDFVDLASLRLLNESAIREHALRCSKENRAGRFTRVGEDFFDEVRADVEAFIREIRNRWPTSMHAPLSIDENTGFVTGALTDRLATELNEAVGRLVQNKVQRQPSCGKTLGRTR